jgi:hypothetical protein
VNWLTHYKFSFCALDDRHAATLLNRRAQRSDQNAADELADLWRDFASAR